MIDKGMEHNQIVYVVKKEFEKHFDVQTNVKGCSHYRGSRVHCKADLMMYDRINGFLFGVEVKTFYTYQPEWIKQTLEQMVSYNDASWKMPNHLNRPLHPHAFFLASPLTNQWEKTSALGVIPGGLGLLQMSNVSAPGEGSPKKLLNLRLTSGERLWNNHQGYHVHADELLSPQVGSQKVVHEAVGVKLEGEEYRKNVSVSSQNRCQQDFR